MANDSQIQNAFAEFAQQIESNKVEAIGQASTVVNRGEVVAQPATENTETAAPAEDDIFDGAVIAGLDESSDNNSSSSESEASSINEKWEKMLREHMADMVTRDPKEFDSQRTSIINDLVAQKKNFIIKYGFTPEEADEAVMNMLKKKAISANTEYIKNNPNLAVITIDKNKSDSLEFTEEEKKKLVRTKTIRLIEVEDKDIATVHIKPAPDPDSLFKAVHRVSCNVSKYKMPAINTFDMCEFSGATTAQLVQAVYNENENMHRKYQDQLELVYAKFMGSTTIDKYDINGDIIFNKDDFAKWFKFHDLPIALYSIYVASSTEEITSRFHCHEEDGGCGVDYDFTYNTKSLVKYNEITDNYKEDLDLILENEDDRNSMTTLKNERRMTKRFKSPYTGNIYDISAPSVARALSILRYVRPRDNYAQYLAMYAMMLESILVLDPKDGQYFKIDYESPLDIMRYMYDVNEMEIKILTKMMDSYTYVPSFEITTKCKKCGRERTSQFSVDELVFLKAQNIGEEIE